MSRIPGARAAGSKLPDCCVKQKSCCPPGMSRIPSGPGTSRIPSGPGTSRTQPVAGPSRIQPTAGPSRIQPTAGPSRISSSRPMSAGMSRSSKPPQTRTILAAVSRPPMAAISKTVMAGITRPHPSGGKATGTIISKTVITGPSATNVRKGLAVSYVTSKEEVKPRKPSRLQRFDRTVTEELSRRRHTNTTATTTTSDTGLLEAVDHLARAQAAHTFAGAVRAAEAAAADVPNPAAAEEAAAEGARCFQAELVDVVAEDVPGLKPIQVIGYVGITRPKYAAR